MTRTSVLVLRWLAFSVVCWGAALVVLLFVSDDPTFPLLLFSAWVAVVCGLATVADSVACRIAGSSVVFAVGLCVALAFGIAVSIPLGGAQAMYCDLRLAGVSATHALSLVHGVARERLPVWTLAAVPIGAVFGCCLVARLSRLRPPAQMVVSLGAAGVSLVFAGDALVGVWGSASPGMRTMYGEQHLRRMLTVLVSLVSGLTPLGLELATLLVEPEGEERRGPRLERADSASLSED